MMTYLAESKYLLFVEILIKRCRWTDCGIVWLSLHAVYTHSWKLCLLMCMWNLNSTYVYNRIFIQPSSLTYYGHYRVCNVVKCGYAYLNG